MKPVTRDIAEALLLVIEHDRTACSDATLANAYVNSQGYPSCARCYLIKEISCCAGCESQLINANFQLHLEIRVGREVEIIEKVWVVE